MKIKTLMISSLVTLILLSVNLAHGQVSKELAIKIAEEFVSNNGYCSKIGIKSKLSYELFDGYQASVDSLLKHRQNTIYCKAFCISENKTEWHIGFLSTQLDRRIFDSLSAMTDLPGRCIIVSKKGKQTRMAHKKPLYSHFTKL